MSPRVGGGCSGGVQRQQLPRGSWRAWRTDREESVRGCLTDNTTYYYSLRDINCRQQRHRNSTEGNTPSTVPEAPQCVRWMELCVFHREGEKADNFCDAPGVAFHRVSWCPGRHFRGPFWRLSDFARSARARTRAPRAQATPPPDELVRAPCARGVFPPAGERARARERWRASYFCCPCRRPAEAPAPRTPAATARARVEDRG